MAYSELIKSFERIRSYMREFYVYGFKSRDEFDKKSGRSYDNERRRIESYLRGYMSFRQTPSGKNVFLSIDSRSAAYNPLYQALKAKSFTDGDITLHFILFDILYSPEVSLTLNQITEKLDEEYLSQFKTPMLLDESTVRKKLKEYRDLGLIVGVKQGKQMIYHRSELFDLAPWEDAAAYYSEAGMLGVVGSFLLDKQDVCGSRFCFKHHYITHALESEILCDLFQAMAEKRTVTIWNYSRKAEEERVWDVVPLKIFVSAQTGRRYLLGYSTSLHAINSFRLDYITRVKRGDASPQFDALRAKLANMQKHMWGVRCNQRESSLEHVEFTLHIGDGEEHIYKRLEREKRCGIVERIDKNTCRFVADVYDTSEMIPWIRTFLCRITRMNFSNRSVENQFKEDVKMMYRLYGITEGNE